MMTFILKLIEKFIKPQPIPIKPKNVKRILVVDIAYLGDMIMSSFVYRALKENFPEASVEALVYSLALKAVSQNPYIDRINLIPENKKFKQILTAIKLRKNRYDITINLFTGLWGNFLIWLIHGNYRIGYNYRHRGCFNNVRIPISVRTVRSKYRPDECAELLETAFDWKIKDRSPIFMISEESKSRVRLLLQQWNIQPDDFLIGLQTNCRQEWEQRRWDAKKFAELANHLIKKYNAKIVFTGSSDDRDYVDKLKSNIPLKKYLYDALGQSLEDLAALLQRIDIFITNNTGPMHIALSQKTPTVAIIGGYPAHIVFPQNNNRFQYVADKGLEEWDPRPLKPKYTPRLQEITVEDVLQKVESVINTLKSEKNFHNKIKSYEEKY